MSKTALSRELQNSLLEVLSQHSTDPEIATQDYLGNAYNFGDFFYYIFNLSTQRFDHISKEIKQVLGIEPHELNPVYFKDNMHPSDLESYLEMEKIAGEFLFISEPDQQLNYRLKYDCRIRHTSGNYVRILHQILPVKGTKEGAPFRIFGVFTDISHLKMEGKISLSLVGLNGAPTYFGIDALKNRAPSDNILTPRETEILLLLSEDLISKQIAEKLFITTNTVANHRKNMLMKTGTKSTAELLMKAIRNGWI